MVQSVPFRSLPRDQMREERLEILRLLETSAITVDEAATLLEALDRAGYAPLTSESTAPRGAEARQIRIRVTDTETSKAIVNLAVPLGLLKSGLDIAG